MEIHVISEHKYHLATFKMGKIETDCILSYNYEYTLNQFLKILKLMTVTTGGDFIQLLGITAYIEAQSYTVRESTKHLSIIVYDNLK